MTGAATLLQTAVVQPFVIFPTRSADEHALGGKSLRFSLHQVTVEGHERGCRRFGMKSTR